MRAAATLSSVFPAARPVAEPPAPPSPRRPGARRATSIAPPPTASGPSADLWWEVERQAAEMAAREPLLRQMLVDTVLSPATHDRIVAAILSRRLGARRFHDATLKALFGEALRNDPGILEGLEADLVSVTARDPACRSPLHALLHFKGFHALQVHRIAHSLWKRGRADIAHWLANQASVTLGVDIHPAVPIGKGVVLDHATGIVIGETAMIEDDVVVLHGVTLGATGKERGDRHPKVRQGALLGAGAKVLGNVEVGRMSRVAAGSVVVRGVPPYSTVAGVPARVVRTRSPDADGRPCDRRGATA